MESSRSPRTLSYRVGPKDQGVRLDLFLKERIPRMSRESIKEAIRTRVAVAGRVAVRPSTALRSGEEVVVTWPELVEDEDGPAIPVLFSDDHLLAVDKPPGLVVHSTASSKGGSLLGLLRARGAGGIHLVHRLDRETSGVVVLARSAEAARALSRSFAAGAVEKTYVAVVFGVLADDEGTIDLPLGQALRSAVHIKQGVRPDSGRRAVTEYRVVERLDGFTVLLLRPRTGRRHQIRVRLQAIGHPVVGDKLYSVRESHHLRAARISRAAASGGLDEWMRRELLVDRQLLHAFQVTLPHPRNNAPLTIEAPLPGDIEVFLDEKGIREPAGSRALRRS